MVPLLVVEEEEGQREEGQREAVEQPEVAGVMEGMAVGEAVLRVAEAVVIRFRGPVPGRKTPVLPATIVAVGAEEDLLKELEVTALPEDMDKPEDMVRAEEPPEAMDRAGEAMAQPEAEEIKDQQEEGIALKIYNPMPLQLPSEMPVLPA